MISKDIIAEIDKWLDGDKLGLIYKQEPNAQHWARVSKVAEELGEVIAELILWTGQNPRKPLDTNAYGRMLGELADTALTAILAIQHFTKDEDETENIMIARQARIGSRVNT